MFTPNLTNHGFLSTLQPSKKIAEENFGYSGKKFKPKKTKTWISIHVPERESIDDSFLKIGGKEIF